MVSSPFLSSNSLFGPPQNSEIKRDSILLFFCFFKAAKERLFSISCEVAPCEVQLFKRLRLKSHIITMAYKFCRVNVEQGNLFKLGMFRGEKVTNDLKAFT